MDGCLCRPYSSCSDSSFPGFARMWRDSRMDGCVFHASVHLECLEYVDRLTEPVYEETCNRTSCRSKRDGPDASTQTQKWTECSLLSLHHLERWKHRTETRQRWDCSRRRYCTNQVDSRKALEMGRNWIKVDQCQVSKKIY